MLAAGSHRMEHDIATHIRMVPNADLEWRTVPLRTRQHEGVSIDVVKPGCVAIGVKDVGNRNAVATGRG